MGEKLSIISLWRAKRRENRAGTQCDTMYTHCEGVIMAKTATLNVRVNEEIKQQAEQICAQLGTSVSGAVNMLLSQIVLKRSIPFEVSAPKYEKPVGLASMTKEEIDVMLQEGLDDIAAGRVQPMEVVHAELRERYGI